MSTFDVLKDIANPFEFTIQQWFIGYLIRFFAVSVFDHVLEFAVKRSGLMPSRLAGMNSNFKPNNIDRVCLASNSFIEVVFVYNVLYVVLKSVRYVHLLTLLSFKIQFNKHKHSLERSMDELDLVNTLVASVLLFGLDDLLYNLAHRFMHWRPIYPWIHKIHHRQYLPERGYWDAAIEHPVEQLIGLGVFWVALEVVFRVTGMHLAGFLFSFLFYSFFNIVNHMPYDTQFMFLGFTYSTRAHEMHHRYPNCNYSKSCMLWDKLLGTYRPYQADSKKSKSK